MSLQYVGSLSLAGLIPTSFALFASLNASIQAQLTGQLAMSANLGILPPTLEATIQVAVTVLADLQAALALGITLPSVDLSVSLNAQIVILEALIASLQAVIVLGSAAGIDAWTWDGPVNGLGPALGAALAFGSPSGGLGTDHSNALVLITRVSATWSAMATFFGGI